MSGSDATRAAWQQAVAAYQRGDYRAAARALQPLKRLDALPPEVEFLAGVVALHNGEAAEAEQRLGRAAPAMQGNADAWLALGDARVRLERLEAAAEAYRRCLADAPAHVAAWRNLGLVRQRMARDADALECFDRVLDLAPGTTDVAHTRARLLTRMGRRADAEAAYDALVRQCPADVELAIEYAEFLEQANRPTEAERALPDPGALSDALAARVTEIRARLLERGGEPERALRLIDRDGRGPVCDWLGYRKGALLDRLGRHDEAMDAFVLANRARAREARFRDAGAAAFRAYLDDKIRRGVTPASAAAPAAGGASPAFLVGLPRSSTTLLGAMLAAHPGIRLLEEPETLRVLESALDAGASPAEARSAYWRQAIGRPTPPGDAVVLDKNPLHIPQLDAVARVFPDARVVLLLRHPFDAALSCYMRDFAPNPATAHFVDLESTAMLCARLLDMVRCFEAAMPGRVLRIHYEHLVADFPGQVTRVLRGLGLDWHPDVAGYVDRPGEERFVRTPSHAQIVQSLYGSAVGRWLDYSDRLEGFREHLGPRLGHFGYGEADATPAPGAGD